MVRKTTTTSRGRLPKESLHVLDTNVLMHDPSAIFRFQEHDVFLPNRVLEEMDNAKKALSIVGRNVRTVHRYLEVLLDGKPLPFRDVPLSKMEGYTSGGKLRFQDPEMSVPPISFQEKNGDNEILATTLGLMLSNPNKSVILVSKDVNIRIKAGILGIQSEDYLYDQRLRDTDLLYTGTLELPENFWETHAIKPEESVSNNGIRFYEIEGPIVPFLTVNQFIYSEGEKPFYARVIHVSEQRGRIASIYDYTSPKRAVWGITARNREQNFALNLLMDPTIHLVIISGSAGTGKTLLALAAGLAQVLDKKLYQEIIATREAVPFGKDIGFVPGTQEKKMGEWMGAIEDNLKKLVNSPGGGEWGGRATVDFLKKRVCFYATTFMRGRSFESDYLLLDEAQNLTPLKTKGLVTRAGEGTKLIVMGNLAQIDDPSLNERTCGLTHSMKLKGRPFVGIIGLRDIQRSPLAKAAEEDL